MLYDPKWERKTETKPELNSLAGLIAWLEKQTSTTTYDYANCDGACLICQYLTANGGNWRHYALCLTAYQRSAIAAELPQTFGAALMRARKLAANS